MDFARTEAQQDLAGLARRILTDHATPARLRTVEDRPDRFDRDLWSALGQAGVLAAALPDPVGGGFGLLEQCSTLVELGRAVAPVPYLSSITIAAHALATFGTAQQRERWADPAASGDVVLTAALTEPLNPDPARPATTARSQDGGWTVDGSKTAVPAGAVADLLLVPASAPDGPIVLLVRPDDDGVRIERQQVVDGASEAWIDLTGVRLGPERVLGSGPAVLNAMRTRGTVGLCAFQLGVVERALELTAEHARERHQFGRAIGSFQAVAQRLADAYIDVEAVRLTMWQAAWSVSAGRSPDIDVATAKFWAAESGHRVAHTAVHVHGGVGIDLDHPLHRYFVAAKRAEFALGAATEQLRGIGAALAG